MESEKGFLERCIDRYRDLRAEDSKLLSETFERGEYVSPEVMVSTMKLYAAPFTIPMIEARASLRHLFSS